MMRPCINKYTKKQRCQPPQNVEKKPIHPQSLVTVSSEIRAGCESKMRVYRLDRDYLGYKAPADAAYPGRYADVLLETGVLFFGMIFAPVCPRDK